jgi:hypothetical protein
MWNVTFHIGPPLERGVELSPALPFSNFAVFAARFRCLLATSVPFRNDVWHVHVKENLTFIALCVQNVLQKRMVMRKVIGK